MKLRVLDIARAARAKGPQSQEKLKLAYGKLLNSTNRVVGQAKRFSKEIAEGVKRSTDILQQLALEGLRHEIDAMAPRVKQVMKQTRDRIFRGRPATPSSDPFFSRGRRDKFHREKRNHYKGILASSVPKLSQLRPVIVRWSTLFRARLGA